MSSTRVPKKFYDCTNIKTFTIASMMKGLKIDQATYDRISKALREKLQSRNLDGGVLNTRETKRQLGEIFSLVQSEFPGVFEGIPEPWRERCLTCIAQKSNYNHRRNYRRQLGKQRTKVSSPVTELASYPHSSSSPVYITSQPRHRPFGTLGIYVQRKGEGKIVARRANDFLQGLKATKDKVDIDIDDLDYAKFIRVIEEEIGYDKLKERMFYENVYEKRVEIDNIAEWRTCLEEMYWRRVEAINIMIDHAGSGWFVFNYQSSSV